MVQLSFRNRMALYYMITTALLVFVVFVVIYKIVKSAVYSELETDIRTEVADLLTEIRTYPGGFAIIDAHEWKEKEHNTLDVNPIFIQFVDSKGGFLDKSPNLKSSRLLFHHNCNGRNYYNDRLDSVLVRQIQYPVYNKQEIAGYILVAVPLEDANEVLDSLSRTMLVSYPLILLVLYAIARFLAGRNIRPVRSIITIARQISRDNLTSRIPLPPNKDELYVLSRTINELLDRIADAIEREKEFTSNASHELRTPLAVIKGTLEVLVRKPRSKEEYEEKIAYCLSEVNRLSYLTDQLLLLARFENQKQTLTVENVNLEPLVLDTLARQSALMNQQGITATTRGLADFVVTDSYLLSIIIDNLVSNAVKYAGAGSTVTITADKAGGSTCITISDNGIGIPETDLEHIFGRFYRGKIDKTTGISGTGLGLSIVKRLCSILGINITMKSAPGAGTAVILCFGNTQKNAEESW